MYKISLAIIFGFLLSNFLFAADCTDPSGSTVSISTNCSKLDISGDGSDVTIDTGVTIDSSTSIAVKTSNATNTNIINNGTFSATTNYGLRNATGGNIFNLTNNGSITAGNNYGIRSGGVITSLTNSGTISAANDNGIRVTSGGTIGTLTNSGTISVGDSFSIRNDSIINTLINSGTISATNNNSIWIKGQMTTLTNTATGTISAGIDNGIKVVNGSNIHTINNSGTISAGRDFGIRNDQNTTNANTISVLTNSGTISASRHSGLWNDATINTLNNSGSINAITGDFGIKNVSDTIVTLTNSGTISAGDDWGIYNDDSATITTLTNTGTISASGNNFGIYNASDSKIITLNNLQGASSSELTYHGKIPNNYNIIINNTSNFGKVAFTNVSGTTGFGVHPSSTLAEVTYSSIISGLSSGDITSGTSGIHSNSNACSNVNADTVTFSSDCAELDINGDASDITIESGVTISGTGEYDWTLNNGSGTTWDLISTAQLDDAVNTGTNTALNNLGTITAVANSANGLLNNGTFATLTNRGLITSNSAYGIYNAGTITTLNNLQGASSSALTYYGQLPVNYNVIVNSTSDFGKITFNSSSGSTSFGVHSSSTLESNTTYSSVLNGLNSSEIASGTSGSHVSGSSRREWTLINSSGNLWDLVIAADQDITSDTGTSVSQSVKPNVVLGFNNLTSVTEVNFANMNTYDCDLFGKDNICLSLGGRYTSINAPKTETGSAVLVLGHKISDRLRLGTFHHKNLRHKTPESLKLSDKTPITGFLVVWNQNPNHLGYQVKLANAQQQKNATLMREIVGISELGIGKTVIEAKSYVVELQYAFQYSEDTLLRPYFAARSATIKQDAYTESGNNSPLSFNEINDISATILLGLKFQTNLKEKLSLKGSVGVENDIKHKVDNLVPTGIPGLSPVSLSDDFKKTRPVVSLGFDYEQRSNHRFSGVIQYQELPYQSKTESNAYLYYTFGF